MPSYIDQVKTDLESKFPAADGLWNYSTNNGLPADWLLARATNERRGSFELDEVPKLSRRRLQGVQWEIVPPSPEERQTAYERMKSSLNDMLEVQEDQIVEILRFGTPNQEFEKLAESISGLREEAASIVEKTSPEIVAKVFQRFSKATTSLNEYVENVAKSKASANQGWLDAVRQLDESRVKFAETANETRVEVYARDGGDAPPDETIDIPEERIELPEFIE